MRKFNPKIAALFLLLLGILLAKGLTVEEGIGGIDIGDGGDSNGGA